MSGTNNKFITLKINKSSIFSPRMKQLLLIICLSAIVQSYGQFNENAPWMNDDASLNKFSNTKVTLKQQSDAFNQYWKGKDITAKGSGHKPFKRWENHWRNYLLKDGSVATPDFLWNAWNQKQILTKSNVANWQSKGPFTTNVKKGQGRVNVFIIDPNNPNTYYVGAPSGGIWKSTDAGINWTPLSDQIPQIGVSGIAIDPNNSNIIYIATGDDDARDTYSVGVLKSTDGGNTWNTTGLNFTNTFSLANEIYIHPGNSNIVWVATSSGFYKSINAGQTWQKNLTGNILDIKLKPGDPNTIYAVTKSKFYKSVNGGETFNLITSNLPVSSGRFAIDVSPANPNILYLLSAKTDYSFQGLYKSQDSGETFNKTPESDDIFGGSKQAWFDMALTVSPNDANTIYVGVLDIWKSTDGGINFVQKNRWWNPGDPAYTHADIHFLRYFNNKLYAGTDGGIYESSDEADSFTDLTETLNISQYYKISTSSRSSEHIAGGLQDNGGFAFSNNTWHQYHDGDGMDCAVDRNNQNIYYGFTQYGGSLNVTFNGGQSQGITITSAPSAETGTDDRGGSWVTPLTTDNKGTLYAGYSKLYKLNNNTWEAVSSDVFGGDLDNIAIANTDNATIFVSRSNKLFKSTDGGVTFSEIEFFFSNLISSIDINNQNKDIIYLTVAGFNNKVYQSLNGGSSWTDISKNLPGEPKLVIKHQYQSLINDLYLGTSLGVYHINDNMSEWEVFDSNLPNVPIKDLEINVDDKIITVGTYGRGVWQSPIEVAKADTDISLLLINTNNSVQCDGITPIVTVKNNGLSTISQVNINYKVDGEAFDYTYNGSILSDEIKKIELPANNSIGKGKHDLEVEASVNNDAFSDNNILHATFISNFPGIGQYVNTFGDINPDEWLTQTLGNNTELWKRAIATTTRFQNKFDNTYITNPSGNYTDETTSYLISPCYNLASLENPVLKFNMIFDIEKDWDVLYMEYSINSGESWEILGTANDPNWYNSSFIDPLRPITVGKQWTGLDATVKEYSYDLSAFTNESSIIFRFVFASDQAENGEGAAIDNFTIDASAVLAVDDVYESSFKLFPNPSSALFYIQRQSIEKMDLSVFDITGKLVFEEKDILNTYHTLNLSGIHRGIYFLRVNDGQKQFTKRLVIH